MFDPESAHSQSLRHFLSALDRAGDLLQVSERVDPNYELSAYLAELAHGPAVLFESPTGHGLPVVGNLLNSLPRIARGLGVPLAGLQEKIIAAIRAPLPSHRIAAAPCQALVVESPDLGRELPVPAFFAGETGRYVTAGAIVARDTQTGRRNLSFARLKLLEANRAFIGIAPNHHLAVLARAAHARGECLEIAVTIGNHPAVLLAAALYLGLGEDELEVAGALLGEPVEVADCRRVCLQVPAHCEIVLEGRLDMGARHEEGPVSEFHGMYETYGDGPVASFDCMTRRGDALFQVIQPGYHPEHSLIGGVAIAAGLARRLQDAGITLREVAVGHEACGRLQAVLSLRGNAAGQARRAMALVWESVSLVKNVTVVDEDIDPWNPTEVGWACATRMKADRDLVIVPGARTDRSEPLKHEGTVAKLGIDATRRGADRADWTRAAPPLEVSERVRARLRKPDPA